MSEQTESSENSIQTRDPDDLTTHPKNDEIYGDSAPDWFIQSVNEKGVREPVVITEQSHFDTGAVIVSGHRRVDAAERAGLLEVPVRLEKYDTAAEELEALVDYNQQREKNFSQKMREALELEAVERSRANDRQGTRTDIDQNFGESDWGSTSEKVAEMVGFGNPETYRQARKIWMKQKEGLDWAEELVESLDAGDESVYWAYKEVKKREKRAKNRKSVDWDELDGLVQVFTPGDLVHLYEELIADTEVSDWTDCNSLYSKLENDPRSFDAGIHFTHNLESHAVQQTFLYLLEKDGTVTLNGEIMSPDEPASLVNRKPDRDTLEELYLDDGMTPGEISFRFDVHHLLVRLWMYEMEIPLRRKGLTDKNRKRIDEQRGDIDSS